MSERERFEAGSGPMLSDEWIEEHWRQAYSQKAFPALTHYTAAVERAVVDQLWSGQAASGSQENARSDVQKGVGQPEAPTAAPLDMVLHCPKCGEQHIDAPETDEQYNGRLFESSWWECGGDKPERWTNPVHRSHKCSHCNFIWRPADVPTNGVAAVKTKGKADSPIANPPTRSGAGSEEAKPDRSEES